MPEIDPAALFERLLVAHSHEPEIRKAVRHNVDILKCIRGGLAMALGHRLPFDPRRQYWHRPERRLLVAYLAKRWFGRFAPEQAVRDLAFRLFRHFERLREDGLITFLGVDYGRAGGWDGFAATLIQHAQRLGPAPEYERLRAIWPTIAPSAGEHVAEFIRESLDKEEGPGFLEGTFYKRFSWFPYLDAISGQDLARRQRFFFGYANLLTSSNAYVKGGALSFASVIQNTPSEMLLEVLEQWREGADAATTEFRSLDRDDRDPEDRHLHSSAVEIYGFLNLHHGPFYNSEAQRYLELLPGLDDSSPYTLAAGVGRQTRAWLAANPQAVALGAAAFRAEIGQALPHTAVVFESIDSEARAKKAGVSIANLVDTQLTTEIDQLAIRELRALSDLDAAASWLHLLLDGEVSDQEAETTPIAPAALVDPHLGKVQIPHAVAPAPTPPADDMILTLPAPLRRQGEQALSYLRAGLHVLLAGAPGTGKTTLAQFVAHAWNHDLPRLPASIPLTQAPLTTVANSAWSPFHTIGGLMPTGDGRFVPHAGIFIAPESVPGATWRLRNECIVLDEMNRADLDRCIGELYPLLSGSVRRVHPAGLPGVQAIEASARFRMIATMNDATLDDVVFPISEGLARRFQRIELCGASADDLNEYLGRRPDGLHDDRVNRCIEAVREFLLIANEVELAVKVGETERLRIGVGYFALLQAWAQGRLESAATTDESPSQQARRVLGESLSSLNRDRKVHATLAKFRAQL